MPLSPAPPGSWGRAGSHVRWSRPVGKQGCGHLPAWALVKGGTPSSVPSQRCPPRSSSVSRGDPQEAIPFPQASRCKKTQARAFERGARDGQSLPWNQGSMHSSGLSPRPQARTGHQESSLARGEIPKCPGGGPRAPQPGSSAPGQDGPGGQQPLPLGTVNLGAALPLKALALEAPSPTQESPKLHLPPQRDDPG